MIEVLIAVLIMGIGLLGMAAMQTSALRNSQGALDRSQAAIQAYAIMDAMRANADEATIGEYNLVRTCSVPASGATLAQKDLNTWFTAMRDDFAMGDSACATIDCDGELCTVTIDWDDARSSGEVAQFNLSTRL